MGAAGRVSPPHHGLVETLRKHISDRLAVTVLLKGQALNTLNGGKIDYRVIC